MCAEKVTMCVCERERYKERVCGVGGSMADMCLCVCVTDYEKKCVCIGNRERENVCVCKMKRERVCVSSCFETEKTGEQSKNVEAGNTKVEEVSLYR